MKKKSLKKMLKPMKRKQQHLRNEKRNIFKGFVRKIEKSVV